MTRCAQFGCQHVSLHVSDARVLYSVASSVPQAVQEKTALSVFDHHSFAPPLRCLLYRMVRVTKSFRP